MREGEGAKSVGEDRTLTLSRPDVVVRSSRALGARDGRPVVVVLGMHRSGTSLLSNVLQFLGVDMADTTDHTSPKNAGGFWERPELVAIHDEILAAIGRPIGRAVHVLPFPPAWWRGKEVQALKPKLTAYVQRELAKSTNLWGFKDPRTCRLLPLWWEVFRELDLRPLYVHAVRSPAEASVSMSKKSPARKMSVSTGELMWLTYNYDVVRYVTAEHPTVMVDYDEWFDDAPAVARRLADELGIGDDLTPDDIVECVQSIVRSEYRHERDGKSASASDTPMAAMLYNAMTASNPLSSADARGLRGQLRLVDLFLKSLTPIAEELDQANVEQARLVSEEGESRRRQAEAEEASGLRIAEMEEAQRRLVEESAQRDGRSAEQLADAEARIAALEQERAAMIERLGAARSSLDEVKRLAAQSSEMALQDAAERQALVVQLASAEAESNMLTDRLAGESARGRELEAQVAAEGARARELEAKLAADSERARELEAQLAAASEELAATNQALEAQGARLRRHGRRLGLVIEAGKSWRGKAGALAASLDQAGYEAADVAAREQAALALVEERDSEIESLREAHEEALAEVREARELPQAAVAEGAFDWPADPADYAIEGQVTKVDGTGIHGDVQIAGRGDMLPVVELRVGDVMVAAKACVAVRASDRSGDARAWRFHFAWSSIAEEHAGKRATLRLAGVGQELGRANIPDDLRHYHLPPAVIAAEALGGTVGEAEEYHRWIALHEPADDADLARASGASQADGPAITVIVFGGAGADATIASLCEQTYAHWNALCVGAPAKLAKLDPRVKVVRPGALDDALASLSDDALISFVEANDRLAPTALQHLAAAAMAEPGFALIYSDEDRVDPRSGVRGRPYMKGEWSIDLALAQDYVSRLALLRKRKAAWSGALNAEQVYAAALRAALSGAGAVIHVPFVLYHRAGENAARGMSGAGAVAEVLRDAPPAIAGAEVVTLADGGWRVDWPLPDPLPRVSLIVPTRDRVDLLRVCVEGFLHETHYDDLEILIADNGSTEEDTLAYLAKIASHPRVKVIPAPGPFNYSAINNLAARHATGSIIGLMNNDLKIIEPDWLRRMVSHAVRPDVGIVGAKLLHGDDTIQHAGVTLGIGLASHLYKSFAPTAEGHNKRLVTPQDLSAVTAACLLMRCDVWDEVEGLDEEFPVAYNDVDLCLKVRKAGYRVLWSPDVLVYHLESQSRGKDVSPDKRARLDADKARLLERWGTTLASDPFHSPNLSDRHSDARLAFPARVTPPWRSRGAPASSRSSR